MSDLPEQDHIVEILPKDRPAHAQGVNSAVPSPYAALLLQELTVKEDDTGIPAYVQVSHLYRTLGLSSVE